MVLAQRLWWNRIHALCDHREHLWFTFLQELSSQGWTASTLHPGQCEAAQSSSVWPWRRFLSYKIRPISKQGQGTAQRQLNGITLPAWCLGSIPALFHMPTVSPAALLLGCPAPELSAWSPSVCKHVWSLETATTKTKIKAHTYAQTTKTSVSLQLSPALIPRGLVASKNFYQCLNGKSRTTSRKIF